MRILPLFCASTCACVEAVISVKLILGFALASQVKTRLRIISHYSFFLGSLAPT